MISGRVRPPRDGLPGGNATLSWSLDIIVGGVEGYPSSEDVRLGCGVVGRFPRGGEQGTAASPAPVSSRGITVGYTKLGWMSGC